MTQGSEEDDTAARAAKAFGTDNRSLAARRKHSSTPLTAVDVENEILRFIGMLEDSTYELAGRARLAAEAEANHKGMWAQHFLQAEGTEAKRKAEADVACFKKYEDRKIKEALYLSTKEALLSLRAQLDALRSISANIRAQT